MRPLKNKLEREKQLYQYFTAIHHPLPPLVSSSTHPILFHCHCKDQEGGRKRERDEIERLKGGGEGGRERQRKRERVSRQTLCNFSEAVSFPTSRYSLMGSVCSFQTPPQELRRVIGEILFFFNISELQKSKTSTFFFYLLNLCLNFPLSSIPKIKIH